MAYGNREYCIKYKVYNSKINDELWDKIGKEELTPEEHDYLTYCWHYEEYRAYGEV